MTMMRTASVTGLPIHPFEPSHYARLSSFFGAKSSEPEPQVHDCDRPFVKRSTEGRPLELRHVSGRVPLCCNPLILHSPMPMIPRNRKASPKGWKGPAIPSAALHTRHNRLGPQPPG